MDTFDNAACDEPLWGLAVTEPAEPADHVDALLSSLLDIQDDICQTVTWLAENWSLDLPELAWLAGDEYDDCALRLAAVCTTRDALERVAKLFDTTIDPEGPPDGWQWHHARRRFGMVQLDVFYGEHVDGPAARYLAAYTAKANEAPEAGAA